MRRMWTAVLAVGTALAGCGVAPEATTPGGALVAGRAGQVLPQDCARTSGTATEPGAPTLAVVVDGTASAARTSWSDATIARATAVARAGGTLSIIGVDGAGVPPLMIWTRHPLVPPDVLGTPREDAVVALVLACAVSASRAAAPTAPGSDVVGALDRAVEAVGPNRVGSAVELITDGYASAGALRFDTGADPGETPPGDVAGRLAAAHGVADLTGLTVAVHLVPLAGAPQDEASRQWMEEVWRKVLHGAGSLTVDRDAGPAVPGAPPSLPADPVRLAAVVPPVASPAPDLRQLSGNAFFEPGSAALRAGAADLLAPLAALLVPGSGRRAEVVGHVASWGSTNYREQLSRDRAAAIAAALVALGADPGALSVRGAGSREPLVDDLDAAGALVPEQAARNRRVDVLLLSPAPAP